MLIGFILFSTQGLVDSLITNFGDADLQTQTRDTSIGQKALVIASSSKLYIVYYIYISKNKVQTITSYSSFLHLVQKTLPNST
jgi:hypothetical protein